MNKRQRKKCNKKLGQFIAAMRASFLSAAEAAKVLGRLRDASITCAEAWKRLYERQRY